MHHISYNGADFFVHIHNLNAIKSFRGLFKNRYLRIFKAKRMVKQ